MPREAVGEAVADIRNRGLEAAEKFIWTNGQQQPAVPTAMPAQQQSLSTPVEVPGGEPVRPDMTSTTRTLIRFGPGKTSTQLKDALDGSFDEKYQWRYSRECHSHLPGRRVRLHPRPHLASKIRIIRQLHSFRQVIVKNLTPCAVKYSEKLHWSIRVNIGVS